MKNSMMERTMSKSHMEGSADHSVPQADITQLQSQESTSKVHKHDSLINGIRQQELYASISEAYERKFSDSTKIHENDNKQEIQSSESEPEGHKHDNLIDKIRERELHTPLLEKYERILGNSNNIHENKNKQEIQSPESKENKHDNLINGIRERELHASILKEYERRFGDSNKTHENENDNKQEIQSSESEGHEHDNLINGIRERELHTPLLEKYERILGNSNNIYENKHEIQSLGAEGHKRNDDFIQVQAHESISKGYERSTDATANWHNYSEQKLKDLNDAYPQNMKKGDRRSILYNEGTHKLDSAEHEQRLDAMAYKATDWFMNHAVSFEKDPQKAKLVADQIRNSFDTTDKAAALLLLEAVEMQKEYDQQSKFQKYRRVFTAKLLENEMQEKKNELVKLFDVHSERFVRIQQKVAQLGRDSRYYKEHKAELKKLRKELS